LKFTRLSTKEKRFKQYFNSMRFSFWYILFPILLQHVCVSMESQSSIAPTIRAQEKQYSRHNDWQNSRDNDWQSSQDNDSQYSEDNELQYSEDNDWQNSQDNDWQNSQDNEWQYSQDSQSSIVPTIRAQEQQYPRHNWQYPQDSHANEWQYSQDKQQYSQASLSSNWSDVINNTEQNNYFPVPTRRTKRSIYFAEKDQDAEEEQGKNQLKLLHRSSTVCNLISDFNISNLKTYICNIKSFINFLCFSCLGYFLVSKKDQCLVLRHESCPSLPDNIIEIFLDITHFEQIFISVICSCTFYQSKKFKIGWGTQFLF